MSEDDVSVRFGADVGRATGAITQLREVLQGLESPIRGIRNNLGELAEAFAAAFAVEKISELVERMAELGEKTERTAAILGISTEEVGKLNAVAALTGTSADGMAFAMERLQVNLARARDGATPAAQALGALGLSAKELIGLPIPEQLGLMADRIAKFADGGNKTAIVMTLLGRSGAQMIPLLDQGSHGFEEMGKVAERTGTALDEVTTKSLVDIKHGIVEFGLSLQGVGVTLVSQFKPAISGIVTALTDLVVWFNESIRAGGTFEGLLGLLVEVAKALAAGLQTIVLGIQLIAGSVSFALEEMRDAVAGSTGSMKADFEAWQKSVTASAEQWAKRMNEIYSTAVPTHVDVHKEPAPGLNLTTGKETAAALAAIDGQIKVLREGLAQKALILAAEANQHQITEDQKFAQLEAETEKEYQAEMALLQRKLTAGNLDVKQRQQILNQIATAEAQHRTEMIKLDEQSIAARQKLYEELGNAIQSSFNGQLRGLLAGTTSWSQAFKSIMGDMVIYFIEQMEKMVVQWIAGQLAQTTASQTGAAARAAAEVAGTEATLPLRVTKFLSDITSDAAAVFAGVFANMAPLLGPAAAGPAAASQASVLAVGLPAVPKLDIGTRQVLSDGLAMIHRNEAVVPAHVAGAWRDGQSTGGGNTINLTIPAVDGQSVALFFKKHAAVINRILNSNAALSPA